MSHSALASRGHSELASWQSELAIHHIFENQNWTVVHVLCRLESILLASPLRPLVHPLKLLLPNRPLVLSSMHSMLICGSCSGLTYICIFYYFARLHASLTRSPALSRVLYWAARSGAAGSACLWPPFSLRMHPIGTSCVFLFSFLSFFLFYFARACNQCRLSLMLAFSVSRNFLLIIYLYCMNVRMFWFAAAWSSMERCSNYFCFPELSAM